MNEYNISHKFFIQQEIKVIAVIGLGLASGSVFQNQQHLQQLQQTRTGAGRARPRPSHSGPCRRARGHESLRQGRRLRRSRGHLRGHARPPQRTEEREERTDA